jgi:molybdopterin-binding protein
MKISARNQIPGKLVGITKEATTAHVKINIGGSTVITASITNEAVDDLQLKTGAATVIIKVSDVMVGVN